MKTGQKTSIIKIYKNPFPRGTVEAREESLRIVREAIAETRGFTPQTCNASHALFGESFSPEKIEEFLG